MARIEFKNDVTRALEEAEGSDGRLNVSSRADSRSYYNSRDEGQTYSMVFEHLTAVDAQYSFYIQNTSKDKTLVIRAIGLNTSAATTRFKLWDVTGTATGAGDVIPHNMGIQTFNAEGVFKIDTGGTIAGITIAGAAIDDLQVGASGHDEMRLGDTKRLAQDSAIALQVITTLSAPNVFGVVFFYYE